MYEDCIRNPNCPRKKEGQCPRNCSGYRARDLRETVSEGRNPPSLYRTTGGINGRSRATG